MEATRPKPRIMKSAKQTEQKIATVEATLLQRRKYLESIKVQSGFVGKGAHLLEAELGWTRWWFQICFMFTPIWGRWSMWLYIYNIFQMGWKHQLENMRSHDFCFARKGCHFWQRVWNALDAWFHTWGFTCVWVVYCTVPPRSKHWHSCRWLSFLHFDIFYFLHIWFGR